VILCYRARGTLPMTPEPALERGACSARVHLFPVTPWGAATRAKYLRISPFYLSSDRIIAR
jgi:hypothetical protein